MNVKQYNIFVIMLLILTVVVDVFASSLAPPVPIKTNKNEVTREFEQHIPDKAALDVKIEALKNSGIDASKAGNTSDLLSLEDAKKLGSEQSRLSGISENNLESEGRSTRYSKDNAYFDEFETDYTRPGAMAHLKDAEEIADATEKKLGELTAFLRNELKIDCQEVAKASELKDPYYIEIEREQTKEVEYDPKFCEYPRTTYGCADNMTMTCEKRNWSVPWEPGEKTIDFTIGEILNKGWYYSVFWKKERNGIHMGGDSHAVRAEIAKKLKVKIGHIHENIHINARGNGSPSYEVWDEHFAWGSYTVRYRYRGGEETCDKWSNERWDETCNLTSK